MEHLNGPENPREVHVRNVPRIASSPGACPIQLIRRARNQPNRLTRRTRGLSATPWISHCCRHSGHLHNPMREVSTSHGWPRRPRLMVGPHRSRISPLVSHHSCGTHGAYVTRIGRWSSLERIARGYVRQDFLLFPPAIALPMLLSRTCLARERWAIVTRDERESRGPRAEDGDTPVVGLIDAMEQRWQELNSLRASPDMYGSEGLDGQLSELELWLLQARRAATVGRAPVDRVR